MPVVVAPPVVVYEPYEMPQIYIVDQGPVYSGPGIYTNPTVVVPRPLARYPYVGRDYRYLPPYREPLSRCAHCAGRQRDRDRTLRRPPQLVDR